MSNIINIFTGEQEQTAEIHHDESGKPVAFNNTNWGFCFEAKDGFTSLLFKDKSVGLFPVDNEDFNATLIIWLMEADPSLVKVAANMIDNPDYYEDA